LTKEKEKEKRNLWKGGVPILNENPLL